MIKPYDLGKNNLVENSQKILIDEFVRKATKDLKKRIVEAQIEALGIHVDLTSSNTRFNGKRYWFSCPICNKRVGIIYKHPIGNYVGCRSCLKIQYRKQRFKGMIEGLNCEHVA